MDVQVLCWNSVIYCIFDLKFKSVKWFTVSLIVRINYHFPLLSSDPYFSLSHRSTSPHRCIASIAWDWKHQRNELPRATSKKTIMVFCQMKTSQVVSFRRGRPSFGAATGRTSWPSTVRRRFPLLSSPSAWTMLSRWASTVKSFNPILYFFPVLGFFKRNCRWYKIF